MSNGTAAISRVEGATFELRLRRARLMGDAVGTFLALAMHVEPWWRWTLSLAVAMCLERAIDVEV